MKKLLLIAVLIVGCAPKTTATFYIGMTEEEFKDKNSTNSSIVKVKNMGIFDIIVDSSSVDTKVDKSDIIYIEIEKSIGSWLDIVGLFTNYTFWFSNDTLYRVEHGFFMK